MPKMVPLETNIPIYGPHNEVIIGITEKGENGITNEIKHFLAGGVKYGANYGQQKSARFSISADHNGLQTLHRKLIDKLILLGLLDDVWFHRSMSNIEYITPPRAELDTDSKNEHRKDIAAVKTHIGQTLEAARSGRKRDIPEPGNNVFTGIPITAINAWLQGNDLPTQLVKPELDALQNFVNNDLYIQETRGVLPEDIPALFEASSTAIGETDEPSKYSSIMQELMALSVNIGDKAFDELDIDTPAAFETHKKAVVGYLTLLSSYLLADHVSFLKC